MIYIVFLIFAFLTIFLSVKLSIYADNLSKTKKVSKAFIGGILLAGITALPELITCISAISFDNPYLAIGDILGSNLFNIFVMAFFDVIYIKKMFFSNKRQKNSAIYIFLLVNYIAIFLFLNKILNSTILNLGIPTFIILITYFYYLYKQKTIKDFDEGITEIKIRNVLFKLILTIIFIVISSILLTMIVNKIAILNPHFSSSLIGAILLGITTSLPEIISFYTLIMINSYDLAILNVLGSNLFNLMILCIGDFIIKDHSIYGYTDMQTHIILNLGIVITFLNLYQSIRKKTKNKLFYMIPSLIIVILYLTFWFISFR